MPQTIQMNTVEAGSYSSSTDTNVDILDYVENRHRQERENVLLPEQKKLLDDAYRMRNELRNPLDPTKNVPIALEGDDMFYNQNTGEVEVKGNVQLTTLDAKRFNTQELRGNIEKSTVEVDGEAKLLQLTPDQARIILVGYKTQYDYTRSLGKMEDINGKVDNKYIKGNRVELYPDLVVIYNGYATKCSAKHPDYRMAADRIEIYPDGRTISYGVKYYLGDMLVYQSSKEISDPNSGAMPHLPRVGYNSDNGVWISDEYRFDIVDRVHFDVDGTYSAKKNLKGGAALVWDTKALGSLKVYQGHYEDSDNRWIRKGPTVDYRYSNHIADTPFIWSLHLERGKWHQGNVHSIHTKGELGLTMDPIPVGVWQFTPATDFSITKETADGSKKTGMGYSLTLLRDFDPKWAYFARYQYSQVSGENSVFKFDVDDYSKRFSMGVSYRMTRSDRFVAGYKWDVGAKTLKDIDWYWFRDMHCAEMIVRYRPKKDSYSVTLQFTPW